MKASTLLVVISTFAGVWATPTPVGITKRAPMPTPVRFYLACQTIHN